jgi:hypothetical protein
MPSGRHNAARAKTTIDRPEICRIDHDIRFLYRIFGENPTAMKKSISLLFIAGFCVLSACNTGGGDTDVLQTRIDSLQRKLDDVYKPGLGEFMSGLQVHHAKLWFAGNAENWKLANFEVGEIKEAFDDVEKYCTDRPEVASLPMIRPAVDSVSVAIGRGNLPAFKNAFMLLTTFCNNCHRATRHEFNVIKVPDTPPFTNQVFTKQP